MAIDPKAKDFYRAVLESYMTLQEHMKELEVALKSQTKLVDLADCDYAIDRAYELADTMRKKIKHLGELSTKLTVIKYLTDPTTTGDPIRTEYVTVSPSMVLVPQVPSREKAPEHYEQFMRDLGVSDEESIKSGVVAPHWPKLVEHITKLAENGEPLPAGCDPSKTYPVYDCKRRKKKEVLD